ncbi:MAG: Ig-like domain-containing protein [Ilumatobacteraceae bacterium]
MGQLQKVSWRTAGYAALGTVVAAAAVVAVINSDGVRPTSLTSNSATRWLFDQSNGNVVLVDGLAGNVIARIDAAPEAPDQLQDQVAVQGAGGAFLVAKKQGSIRTISTAKLQLGTAQPLALLTDLNAQFGVGANGLTIVSPDAGDARVVAVDDVTRQIAVPPADTARVAADGSMWLLSKTRAIHVNVDETRTDVPLRSISNQIRTIGARAVAYDNNNSVVRWLDGGDVDVSSIPNASEATLQESGDSAACVWLGVGDTLACIDATGIDRIVPIRGMNITSNDRLAVAGSAAVIVSNTNQVQRIDLENQRLTDDPAPTVRSGAPALSITAAGNLIWLDDQGGEQAWVVHRFGINAIDKNDETVPLLDAQGQPKPDESGTGASPSGGGNAEGTDNIDHIDPHKDVQDPPVAIDDSVTARAGTTITIPVTGNDYDPEGDAIAVDMVGTNELRSATHGTTDVLNGTSVAYRPDPGYVGSDYFEYQIVDEFGGTSTATVNVELFAPDSPNRPPIARRDTAKTRVGRSVTIDVLANDIDPERDMLTVPTFQSDGATITDKKGPTGLEALEYTPPPDRPPGIYKFTYQAADPQGGTSEKTEVTVEISGDDTANQPPVANSDAIRLSVGVAGTIDVKANDSDPDGDPLTISAGEGPRGVDVLVVSQQVVITLEPGASKLESVHYTLSDEQGHDVVGKVLVLRVDDTAPNRPPVANPDAERVVIGNSVKIPVTANDVDPDHDRISLLTADKPVDGAGITVVEGNSVRFTPNLPDITESTPVTFRYRITDGHGHETIGTVTVTVLVEALTRAPLAGDDFADTVKDKPVTIDVLKNDSDPSGGTPSLTGDPVCANGGKATRTADNRVTFDPPPGDTGVYRCRYRVANYQGRPAEASIIITVTEPPQGNRLPIIDTAKLERTVRVGEILTLNANEIATDPDHDSLVFTSVTKPDHGKINFTLTVPVFTYTPPAEGSPDKTPVADNLNVTISDGHDGNVSTQISIKIVDTATSPPNTPPITHDITRSASVGETIPIDVVAELRDLNSTTELTLTGITPGSGPGTAEQSGNVAIVKVTGPGVVVVNYTVANSDKRSASGQIKVTVTQPTVANPPVAVDDTMTINSGGTNSIDLTANDTGISDPGDKPSVLLLNRPPSDFGSVELINGWLSFNAAPGFGGLVELRYSLSDGSGLSSTANVTINVLACADSLPNARLASIFTPYQTPIAIDLTSYLVSGHIRPGSVSGAGLTGTGGTYSPPPGMNGTESVTYIVENGCQQTFQGQLTIDVNRVPVGGNVTRNLARGATLTLTVAEIASDDETLKITGLNSNPSWVSIASATGLPGTSDETTIGAAPPASTPSGTYTFTAAVLDPGGLTATATITLVISNLPPTAVADAYFTTLTNSLYTVPDPTVNDTDSEPGPLTIQTVSVLSGAPSDAIKNITGNAITLFLPHGVTTLSYTIADGGGLTSSSTITITSNRAPTIEPGAEQTHGSPTAHLGLTVAEPDGDAVTVSCPAPPGFLTTILANSDLDGNPPDPFHPQFELSVSVPIDFNSNPANSVTIPCTVTDSFGASATAPIIITVE